MQIKNPQSGSEKIFKIVDKVLSVYSHLNSARYKKHAKMIENIKIIGNKPRILVGPNFAWVESKKSWKKMMIEND